MRLGTLVSFTLSCLVLSTAAQDGTCWGVNGKQWVGNKQCPGSSACCGEDATCMPNRLCKNKDQADDEFVRGPCAVAPYDNKKCASICVYEETGDRFPRVKKCSDGSYCCDNDAGCCSAGRGTFLDAKGNVLDGPSATTSSEAPKTSTASAETTGSAASKASTESAASVASTASEEPSTSASSDAAQGSDEQKSNSGGDGQSLKIGLGVAIPATAIIAALAAWFFFRRKQARTPRTKEEEAQASGYAPDHASNHTYYSEMPATEHRRDRPPQELPS